MIEDKLQELQEEFRDLSIKIREFAELDYAAKVVDNANEIANREILLYENVLGRELNIEEQRYIIGNRVVTELSSFYDFCQDNCVDSVENCKLYKMLEQKIAMDYYLAAIYSDGDWLIEK